MDAAQVAANFTAVNETLIPKQQVLALAVQHGLIDLVNSSMSQLTNVNDTIINTMNGTTQNVKEQCNQAADALQDAMTQLNSTIGSINLAGINNTVIDIVLIVLMCC